MKSEKVLLVILDGWGHGPDPSVSAIAQANTPFVDGLYKAYPHSELVTHGESVGLPEGQMGNSEVGHLNIGAGRIVYQELARINRAISKRELHTNSVLLEALDYAKLKDKKVHLLGLLSDGGVHSHIDHLLALCDIVTERGVKETCIHAFMDGRDTDPKGGISYIKKIEEHIEDQPVQLATVIGRYYAMDRDQRWERIKMAYDLLIEGKGKDTQDVVTTIQELYSEGITDEFLPPIVCMDEADHLSGKINAEDVVICFNFRTDRLRQLTRVLSQEDMPDFKMKKLPLHYVTMTSYNRKFKDVKVLFTKENLSNTLGEVISSHGCTQVRIAETEKYPHVTFFFSGGREAEFEGERRILIASPKVATYDKKPQMSANEVTDAIIKAIREEQPDFICLNYANADMVGHTGVFEAGIQAVETVDSCLKKLIGVAFKYNYTALVIADHGNADCMINNDGSPNTAHSTNPVPFILVSERNKKTEVRNGKLADIAPTILGILGLPVPAEMNGRNLVKVPVN